jgi:hypothetical protein
MALAGVQAEKALLQAPLPYLLAVAALFLVLGLVLLALGPRALRWLPVKPGSPIWPARGGGVVRLTGVGICITSIGLVVQTVEMSASLDGGHPTRFGTTITLLGVLVLLAVTIQAGRKRT